MSLGDHIQSLKVRQQLQCHVTYQFICVILFYMIAPNGIKKKIKMHLLGILNHSNVSMSLVTALLHLSCTGKYHSHVISSSSLDLNGFNS